MTSLFEPPNSNYSKTNIKILEYLSAYGESYVFELARVLHEDKEHVRTGVAILESLGLVDVRMKGNPRLVEITEKGWEELALLSLL